MAAKKSATNKTSGKQPMSEAETRQLIAIAQDAGRPEAERIEARNEVVSGHLGFAFSKARQFLRQHQLASDKLSDLEQEAAIGLMTAVERFELSAGTRFTTYAAWWICQALRRYHQADALIPEPVYVHSARAIEAKRGRGEKTRDLSPIERGGLEAAQAIGRHESLGTPSDDASGSSDWREPADTREIGPIEAAIQREQAERIAALGSLPERQRVIVVGHYGLDGQPARPMTELCRGTGIPLSSAWRLLEKAIETLREQLEPIAPEPSRLAGRLPGERGSADGSHAEPEPPALPGRPLAVPPASPRTRDAESIAPGGERDGGHPEASGGITQDHAA
jgi:RNA polymerase sigma factor (sigma-70 family)